MDASTLSDQLSTQIASAIANYVADECDAFQERLSRRTGKDISQEVDVLFRTTVSSSDAAFRRFSQFIQKLVPAEIIIPTTSFLSPSPQPPQKASSFSLSKSDHASYNQPAQKPSSYQQSSSSFPFNMDVTIDKCSPNSNNELTLKPQEDAIDAEIAALRLQIRQVKASERIARSQLAAISSEVAAVRSMEPSLQAVQHALQCSLSAEGGSQGLASLFEALQSLIQALTTVLSTYDTTERRKILKDILKIQSLR